MEVEEYIEQKKCMQIEILNFLESENDKIDFFPDLIHYLELYQICDDKRELEILFSMIINISNNHYHETAFFNKIEQILMHFKDIIKTKFSNHEILKLFGSNKRVLLFLINEQIFTIDNYITNLFQTNSEYQNADYFSYFCQTESEKCLEGENDSYICKLIRNDSIDDFIIYINKECISLQSKIIPSIYETNSFLIENKITNLIQYAAFFGSYQIFKYLLLNNVNLDKSLMIYAIHGKNPEIIHLIEENQDQILKYKDYDDEISFIIYNMKDFNNEKAALIYLEEAIKCYHDDIANYFDTNYISIKKNNISKHLGMKYFNFNRIDVDFILKQAFYDLCMNYYSNLIEILLHDERFKINELVICSQKIFMIFLKKKN